MATDVSTIHERLEVARRDLLDLTARNRLLNTPQGSRYKRIDVVEELSEEVFRILVREGRAMTFLPKREPEPADNSCTSTNGVEEGAAAHLAQPEEDEEADENGTRAGHTDTHLQTRLDSESLQKRLLSIYYDARTFEEEQGANILYLSMGFLRWYESASSDKARFAPLLLIPVQLERPSARKRFRLSFVDEELTTNLSLQTKLQAEFGVEIPDLPYLDDLSPNAYFAAVEAAIQDQPRWSVERNQIILWFFSFAKFLMYRDLDPATWPAEAALENHSLVSGLLGEGFESPPPLCGEDEPIDRLIAPQDMTHVMDADSSQTLAIEEVRRGRNLVIQGPPGTGKSQTITNLIATAVNAGQSVLFVSEKMAALEVVKNRLDQIGLGDMCLELHSHKANKKSILQELERTLNLGRPTGVDFGQQAEALRDSRETLNRHAESLHTPLTPSGVTPFRVIGELVRLSAEGVEPAQFELPNAATWSRSEVEERERLLGGVVSQLREIGDPREHPWRGVCLETPLLPSDVTRLAGRLTPLIEQLERVMGSTSRLAEILQVQAAKDHFSAAQVMTLARMADRLAAAPPMDRQSMAHPVWDTQRDAITDLVQHGRSFQQRSQELGGVVAAAAWELELSELVAVRRDLAAHGGSWLRWLSKAYRQAQATLRGLLTAPLPKPLSERLRIVDGLIEAQRARKSLESPTVSKLGAEAFGTAWRGTSSDWAALEAVLAWEAECRAQRIPKNFRQVLGKLKDAATAQGLARKIASELKQAHSELQEVFRSLAFDLQRGFTQKELQAVALHELSGRLRQWRDETEGVTRWIAFYIRWRQLQAVGLDELAAALVTGRADTETVPAQFRLAYFESLMRATLAERPELAAFEGNSHEKNIAEFRRLDVARIEAARKEVALAHHRTIPRGGDGVGELSIVWHEIKKKRRHKPIRQLLREAGAAVRAIKPVFMMSPISIAQFLEPGALHFDLLLMDEASQVRPVDALGAIARCGQVVVVGDDKQLPPTRFFNTVLDEEFDEADSLSAADLESVLGLCMARQIPQRMLRWHYRSRHHSLIAVSNREFYDNRLFVVPSPTAAGRATGLRFHHISDGVFDRGGTATNRIEARQVAQAVIEHARREPESSLGVGTFSVSQRDAILDELELLRREEPGLETFFATGRPEPFFVKNLENIQGDERDVIFISIGYARDKSGYMAMNFGPLSNEGGERRLNVLITRARLRCEVFSSITADDIDLRRARTRGAAAFKTFLDYAQSGRLDAGRPTGRDHDSEFEVQVAKALQEFGYEVEAQVGVAGFFVDLAVVDPERPGAYILGIECDGASYHSSRSARDRDRLRQAVLESRGWTIHRIWSTDWFHRPEEQLRKTLAAIERAQARGAVFTDTEPPAVPPIAPAGGIERDAGESDEVPGGTNGPDPYTEAAFEVDRSVTIHELAVPRLADYAQQVVEVEGPIHADEVCRRLTALWGQNRAGSRITAAVRQALAYAARAGRIDVQEDFYFRPGGDPIPIRNRENVNSTGLRKPDMLPPAEVAAAILKVVEEHIGVRREEVIGTVVRMLGFKGAGAKLKAVIHTQVDRLTAEGRIEERSEKLYLR